MLMLECYFDDSGTHDQSKVVTWGGLLGTVDQWDYLEKRWKALLAKPLEGKLPLECFHLSHCAALDQEFMNYNRAASDRVRFLFRQIIADAQLESYAFSVPVEDYNDLVKGPARRHFGGPKRIAVSGCILKFLHRAKERGEEFVSITFDEGHITPEIQATMDQIRRDYKGPPTLVSIGSMPVRPTPALQAADTIATEAYWAANALLRGDDVHHSAHLRSLLGKVEVIQGYIMQRDHVKKLVRDFRLHPGKRPPSWIRNG